MIFYTYAHHSFELSDDMRIIYSYHNLFNNKQTSNLSIQDFLYLFCEKDSLIYEAQKAFKEQFPNIIKLLGYL